MKGLEKIFQSFKLKIDFMESELHYFEYTLLILALLSFSKKNRKFEKNLKSKKWP